MAQYFIKNHNHLPINFAELASKASYESSANEDFLSKTFSPRI